MRCLCPPVEPQCGLVAQVQQVAALDLGVPVWRVEWNLLGTWLAASCADAAVQLWRANLLGEWSCLHRLVGAGSIEGVPG
jgi:hypothetical protein